MAIGTSHCLGTIAEHMTYLLICLCLKLDSFLLAGLMIASDGLT